jgi:hypothetical protein
MLAPAYPELVAGGSHKRWKVIRDTIMARVIVVVLALAIDATSAFAAVGGFAPKAPRACGACMEACSNHDSTARSATMIQLRADLAKAQEAAHAASTTIAIINAQETVDELCTCYPLDPRESAAPLCGSLARVSHVRR